MIRLDSATTLEDLRTFRGNRLEALGGRRKGQFVPANRISLIVNEKRGITADTAARLGRYFGTSAQYWLNIRRSAVVGSMLRVPENFIAQAEQAAGKRYDMKLHREMGQREASRRPR